MPRMLTATIAKLTKLKPSRSLLFIFGRCVITMFANFALQNNVIARHNYLFLSKQNDARNEIRSTYA